MSRRAILIVLDGLGVGALDDVAAVRPQDRGADSLAHALEHAPAELPFLAALGLGNAAPTAPLAPADRPAASWGRSALGYPGADSFLGHQVLMGGDVRQVRLETLEHGADGYARALARRGHEVRRVDGLPVLLVDGAMLVHDSLEADPGMNYNVTGSLDHARFEDICAVAEVVRSVAPVPRVIAVGARDTPPSALVAGVHARDGAVGIDTPGLGIYERGAEILHLGLARLTGTGQLPALAAAAGLPVTLVGKMADIVACEPAVRRPAVETAHVLALLDEAVAAQAEGVIAANVQELDLAGHRGSPGEYVAVLQQADVALSALVPRLRPDDLLVVTGDHGNDPTKGAMHTREAVPILVAGPGAARRPIGERATLADIGATLAAWLGLPPTASGTSFLEAVR